MGQLVPSTPEHLSDLWNDELLDELNDQEKLFVLWYIAEGRTFCNATRSAEKAGYNSEGGALRVMGHKLRVRPRIAQAIEALLRARVATPVEALTWISDAMRGGFTFMAEITETREDGGGVSYEMELDVPRMIAEGYGHLIREIKMVERTIPQDEGEPITERRYTCKVVDPMMAQLRYRQLYEMAMGEDKALPLLPGSDSAQINFYQQVNNYILTGEKPDRDTAEPTGKAAEG